MMLDSPEVSMCADDDDDDAIACDKKKATDENYVCFSEYKADIYKYMREREVMHECC